MVRSVWTQVWITLVVATVLLAFYTSLGRQLIPLIETQKPRLESLMTGQLGLPVNIDQLKGDWNLLSPVVRIKDINIGLPDDQIHIGRVEAELDISASAFYLTPVFKRIQIDQVQAALSQDEQGNIYLGDEPLARPKKRTEGGNDKKAGAPAWLTWLGLQQAVELTNWEISNASEGDNETLLVRKVLWRNRGNQHALEGDVSWGREEIADIYLAAELRGDLWPWEEQDGEVYIRVDEQQWTRWIPDQLPRELKIDTLRGSMEGWLSISDGDLKSLYVRGTVPEMTLQAPDHELALTDGRLLISGEREDDDWHLRVIPAFSQPLPVSELRVSSVKLDDQRTWQFAVPRADLQEVSDYILRYNLLPERFNHYVTNLNLRGEASDLRISLVPESDARVDIRADVAGLTTDSYMGIPSFTDADGSVHIQPQGGVADIRDESLSLHVQDVYNPQWDLKDATAKFYWAIAPEFFNLRLQGLDAELKDTRVRGDLAIRIPKRESDVEYHFALMLGVEKGPVTLQQELVPDMLDPAINEWLDQGLVEGDLNDVGFILNGHIGSGMLPNSVTTQLYLEAENARIHYLEGWPEVTGVKGRVFMDSPDLDVVVEEATTLGGSLKPGSGRVALRDTSAGTRLTLSGEIAGDASEGLAYLQDTELSELIGGAVDEWQASGPVSTDLRLSMILGKADETPEVTLTSRLQGATLALTDIDLSFSNLRGPLNFDTNKGLSAPALTGTTFGGPLKASLRSEKAGDSFHILADASGTGQWEDVKRWADLFLLTPVSGSLDYTASLSVDPRLDDPVHLLLESGLKGTLVDLPAPAGKTAEEERSLTVLVAPADQTMIATNYDGLMRTKLLLGEQGVDRGDVVFGGEEAGNGPDTGISIRGHVPGVVNASDWWDVWDDMMLWSEQADQRDLAQGIDIRVPENALGNTNPVTSVDLTVEGIDAWDVPVGLTRLAGKQEFDEWTFQLKNNLARGTIVIQPGETDPIVLLMDFVHIPEADDPPDASGETVAEDGSVMAAGAMTAYDPLQELVPADMSAIDFTIQEVYYGTRNFGRWQGRSRPVPSGLSVEVLDSNMKGLNLKGRMDWIKREGQHATRFENFSFNATDIENIQKAFRQQAVISGKEMDGTLNMNWIGSPAGFNAASLNGDLSVRVKNGAVNAEGTGAMKAFGALNFNSVFRRLRLDFSDLVGSGMAFDTLKGKAIIENGVATLTEPVTVDGPGGKFLTSGMTDLNTGELDLKLAVTFPVTSTLPLVAVLAGFAPPVAASIYVTERLIGDELERFTSASYTIEGTWEAPEVKLNKAFDNDVDGKTSRSFLDRVLSIFGLGGDD